MVKSLELSGYKPYTEVLAQRSVRGKHRKTYVLSLPLYLIGSYLPIPNPDEPFPGNRRVNKRHAEKFADYWMENEGWAAPPLLIDTTVPLHEDFEAQFSAGGVEFGILRLHQNASASFAILDGQHRILGWKIVGDRIADQLKGYHEKLQRARELEDRDSQQVWEAKIAEAKAVQRRFEGEYVTVEVLQGLSDEDHKQAFNDIASNALGITKSITVSFDRRSMVNRIALDMEGGIELLTGRVDWEKDRVAGRNEHLISGRNLADLVRHVAVGISGRMTRRREIEMNEAAVAALVEKFFEILVDSFPQLQAIQDERANVLEMREKQMILSPTVLRVLAGTFHNLAVNLEDERYPRLISEGCEQARALFTELSKHMEYPLDPGWYDTGYFADEDSKTPLSRAQDLNGLTEVLTVWGEEGEIFIDVE